jgi:hypothetical protein
MTAWCQQSKFQGPGLCVKHECECEQKHVSVNACMCVFMGLQGFLVQVLAICLAVPCCHDPSE